MNVNNDFIRIVSWPHMLLKNNDKTITLILDMSVRSCKLGADWVNRFCKWHLSTNIGFERIFSGDHVSLIT